MGRNFVAEELKVFSVAAALQAAFTAAVTDIITSAAHGLSNEDLIQVASSATLPTGLSASTDYYVRDVTTDTFKVSATQGGPVVDITAAGSGTHTFYLKGKVIMVRDGEVVDLSISTASNAAFNIKVKISNQDDVDFNAAASSTNGWTYADITDLNGRTSYAGSSGYTFTGTDESVTFELETNGMKWMTVLQSSWTAGKMNAKVSLFD